MELPPIVFPGPTPHQIFDNQHSRSRALAAWMVLYRVVSSYDNCFRVVRRYPTLLFWSRDLTKPMVSLTISESSACSALTIEDWRRRHALRTRSAHAVFSNHQNQPQLPDLS